MNELDQVSVEVVCDIATERLSYVQTKFPNISHTTTDYRQVLEHADIQGVVIATPASTHYELVKMALEAGKHVLVEKPLALCSEEASKLIDLAQNQQRVLMVGHTFLYNTAVHFLKDMIQKGTLGEIYYVYAQRLNLGRIRQDLNAMWNFAPHDISVIMHLLDATPYQVSARGMVYLQDGIEDVTFLSLDFSRNRHAQVHVSWLDPQKVRRMTIVGSEKMVIYDDVSADAKIQIYDKKVEKIPSSHSQRDFENFAEFQLLPRSGDVYIPALKFAEPLRVECQHFIECITEGKQPLSDGQNGLQVVKVLEAAQRSIKNNGVVEDIVW
jgi:predicted dehydrogenase